MCVCVYVCVCTHTGNQTIEYCRMLRKNKELLLMIDHCDKQSYIV